MTVDKNRLLFPVFSDLYALGGAWGWTVLRVMLGVWLIPHGYAKLFENDAVTASKNFVLMGWAYPMAWAYFIGGVEFFGGIFLALGLATRFMAAMFAIQMAFISFVLLWPNWAWGKRGMEYALMMGILALVFVFRGGERWSLDHYLPKEL